MTNKETTMDIKCDKCGHELVKRVSKYGEFLACSNYPKCKYIKKEEKSNYNDKAMTTKSVDVDMAESIDAKIKKGASQSSKKDTKTK